MVRFLRRAAGSLLVLASVTAQAAESSWLLMQAPDETQELSETGSPPPAVGKAWYALTIEAQSLSITAVTSTRKPAATLSFTALQELEMPPPPAPRERYTLALPAAGAVFAFQPAGARPVERTYVYQSQGR